MIVKISCMAILALLFFFAIGELVWRIKNERDEVTDVYILERCGSFFLLTMIAVIFIRA